MRRDECRARAVVFARHPPLDLRRLRVFNLVGFVRIARLFAGVDIEKFSGGGGAWQFFDQLARSRQPVADAQLAADISKRILQRIGIPDADAVSLL